MRGRARMRERAALAAWKAWAMGKGMHFFSCTWRPEEEVVVSRFGILLLGYSFYIRAVQMKFYSNLTSTIVIFPFIGILPKAAPIKTGKQITCTLKKISWIIGYGRMK